MNFTEYWNKGKIYHNDPYLPECKNCEGIAAEYAWKDCKREILDLIHKFNLQNKEKDVNYILFLLREKIEKEI